MGSKVQIAIFARAPVPGQAKTRLIPMLGAQRAAELQHALMLRTLDTALAADIGPVSLWCAPDCEHPAFAQSAGQRAVTLHAQRGGDLGVRMLDAFSRLCACGATIIVGTDCPALGVDELRQAETALREHAEAVFIPAEDGGYALIGLRRPVALLFHDIAWGGEAVMATTRDRLRGEGLRYCELATTWDVDRPEDYQRLCASGLMSGTHMPAISGGCGR